MTIAAKATLKNHVPGPSRLSPFGSLAEMRRDPIATLLSAREGYGDVVKLRVGIWQSYLLSHPDDIKHVLQDNQQNYLKGFMFEYLKPVLGLGLLTNSGESWRRQRRLAQPAFHRQRLDNLTGAMTSSIEKLRARWRRADLDKPIDIVAEMTRLALDIVGRALFGVGFDAGSAEVSQAVKICQEHINWQIMHIFTMPDRYPTPRNMRFRRAIRLLNDAVYAIIDQRRNALELPTAGIAPSTTGDLLTMLLEARDEDTGEGMTDLQLRDEVMTIFLAGHETTANALAWAWHLLSLNPEVEERLKAEVDTVLSGRLPCLADLPRLTYTRMVFDEALRLRPPVWTVGRFPLTADEAGGYRIPAQTTVVLSPYVTHRHPEFWEEPERFDPDRFSPELVAKRPRYAYFPFGGGPRMCIGSEFATMEGVLTLAAIASEFRLSAPPGHVVEMEPLVTLRPRGGLPMRVERR